MTATSPITGVELKVILFLFALLFLVGGGVLLYFGYTASTEQEDAARSIIRSGWGAIGCVTIVGSGGVVASVKRGQLERRR